MSKSESLDINEKFPQFILYAPKIKLKKATITPTPFSLNDSDLDELPYINDKNNDSFDKEEKNELTNFQNISKNNIASYTLKIKRTSINKS